MGIAAFPFPCRKHGSDARRQQRIRLLPACTLITKENYSRSSNYAGLSVSKDMLRHLRCP